MCKCKFKPAKADFAQVSKFRVSCSRPAEIPAVAIRRGLFLVRRNGLNQVYYCGGADDWCELYDADHVRTLCDFGGIAMLDKEVWEGMAKCWWMLKPKWETQYWAHRQLMENRQMRLAGRKYGIRLRKRDYRLWGRLGEAIQKMASFGLKISK